MGVVSWRWVWLVGVGGIYGCGCKEVYRFPHTTYPYVYTPLISVLFLQQHPYFLFLCYFYHHYYIYIYFLFFYLFFYLQHANIVSFHIDV